MTTAVLALLLTGAVAPVPASGCDGPDSLLPVQGGTVGRQWVNNPPYEYLNWPNQVGYGYSYSVFPPASVQWHGWLRFDLSGFPDSTRFDEARLLFNQYYDTLGPGCRLTGFASTDTGAEEFYHLVDTSTSVSADVTPIRGWNSLELNAAGLALLDSCLAGNHVYLGIRHAGGFSSGDIRGLDEPDSLWPRLALTWHTGVSGPGQRRTPARSLAVRPNPARGPARLLLPEPTSGTLAVLDVTGRQVWRTRIEGQRTGTVQLPLLPAGVYLVRLETDTLTATEKLVVQH